MEYQIILASGSPRRKELLELIGVEFKIITSNKEEVITSTNPEEVVKDLSMMKAEDVAAGVNGPAIILGADTVVAHGGRILGKPKDKEDAFRMIRSFVGEDHYVYTGVCIIKKEADGNVKKISFAEGTKVTVYPMTEEEIECYISSGECDDKAGAYAIQGRFAPYIKGIEGDYYNIVGFPIAGIYQRLKAEGINL
ncbi:MAG: septum formation protein Maf [Lachnospiraceae bacterium]|nr:septum formation protein Maf [Lachnospiraceae bacterium]MBQ8632016.1 septum formation protein Maf [Lachnospiraceae bacterium]